MIRKNISVQSERAEWAWIKISDIHSRGATVSKEYATHSRKLPARLQVNGLGQTLAFLFSKSSEKKETGAGHLLVQLGERIAPIKKLREQDRDKPREIMRAVVNMTPDEYRRCTHELMNTAEWLKRFVDGLFEKESE